MLTTYHTVGMKRHAPRIWLESSRLTRLGFTPKTFLEIKRRFDCSLVIKPSPSPTRNRVSSKQMAFILCPIIDINSRETLQCFEGYEEVKLQGTFQQLTLTPSQRAFNIAYHRRGLPINTIEYFAGGSTLTSAITDDDRFRLVAAVEMSPRLAAHFDQQHPDIPLFQCDIRQLNPRDLPRAGFMFASLPCECFSPAGVAKNKLKGCSELGTSGDLYINLLQHVNAHAPLALMVENVRGFFTSLAGLTVADHLRKMGYCVTLIDLNPVEEWNEPQDRKRGVLVATWGPKFYPSIPMIPFTGVAGDYLDAPDPERDAHEAQRVAKVIEGRKRHMERHRAAGNGFKIAIIDHQSPKVPTITKNYYKINSGPYIGSDYGLRLLRQEEIQRLMGYTPKGGLTSQHYDTAVQILGQGVQTRIFRQLIQQLGDFLEYQIKAAKPTSTSGELGESGGNDKPKL